MKSKLDDKRMTYMFELSIRQTIDQLREIRKRRPLEATAISAMTEHQRMMTRGVMERSFARASWWWKGWELLIRIRANVTRTVLSRLTDNHYHN